MKKLRYFLIFMFIFLCINVNNVYAINLSCEDIKLGINTSKKLSVTDANGLLTWSSSDDSVVTVNDGNITGVSVGSAYISVMDSSSTATCKVNVVSDYVPVTGLNLSSDSATIGVNETVRINATVTPSNATDKKVSYTSGDSSIATVDSSGIVTGKSAGRVYIYASLEGKTASFEVTVVSSVALKGITITPSTVSLDEGATSKLTITYEPSNATNKKVTWKSSNTGVVTVDDNGNLKGIASGTATITAIANDGGKVGTAKVVVNAIDKTLKGISLSKKELVMKIGDTETLTVVYNPTNADKKGVTWKSSNSKIVSVDEGKLTALKPGMVEITVTSDSGDYTAVCKVKVSSPPIEAIKFSKEEMEVPMGDKVTLETVSTPEDAIIEDAIWTSSDETVATVSDGELKALKIGTTEVTVSDKEGKIKATIKVNVIEAKKDDLVISIDGYDLNFDPNVKEYTLKIGDESSLNINVNRDNKSYVVAGNRDLQNGSIITVTVKEDGETLKYIINIKKQVSYVIYFIAIITGLLLINLIRILVSSKKKKSTQE